MIDSVGNISNQPVYTSGSNDILGKNDFLELFVAQLKYQDPMNPMEGTEFASQLAQFSSVEQLANISEALYSNIDANYQLTQAVSNTMTAALIGKDAKISGNELSYIGQESISLGYELPVEVNSVTIKIYDAQGQVIRTLQDNPLEKGSHKITWDFTDAEGNKVTGKDYTFKIEAKGTNNEELTIDSYIYGNIQSIKFTENGTKVVINGVEYYLSEILEVLTPTTEGEDDAGN